MANEKIIAQKEKEVNELAEKIKAAKIVLLTDYRGITVDGVTGLRAELRKANSEYKVIKNNITKRALEKCEYAGLEDVLVGPTAVIMNNEEMTEFPLEVLEAVSSVSNSVMLLTSGTRKYYIFMDESQLNYALAVVRWAYKNKTAKAE